MELVKEGAMRVGQPLKALYTTQKFGLTDFAKANPNLYKVYGGIHGGVDYRARVGTSIYAVFDGIIKTVVSTGGFGYHIKLFGIDGRYMAIYGHLSSFYVSNGCRVSMGDMLGKTGNTGATTAPHLHLEFRDLWKGKTIPEQIFDPVPSIKKGSLLNISPEITVSKNQLIKALGKKIGVIYTDDDKGFQGHLKNKNIDTMLQGFFDARHNKTINVAISIIEKELR